MQKLGPNSMKNKQQIANYTDKVDDRALLLLMNISTSGWMVIVIFIGLFT
jgi:hypothetical protein